MISNAGDEITRGDRVISAVHIQYSWDFESLHTIATEGEPPMSRMQPFGDCGLDAFRSHVGSPVIATISTCSPSNRSHSRVPTRGTCSVSPTRSTRRSCTYRRIWLRCSRRCRRHTPLGSQHSSRRVHCIRHCTSRSQSGLRSQCARSCLYPAPVARVGRGARRTTRRDPRRS